MNLPALDPSVSTQVSTLGPQDPALSLLSLPYCLSPGSRMLVCNGPDTPLRLLTEILALMLQSHI